MTMLRVFDTQNCFSYAYKSFFETIAVRKEIGMRKAFFTLLTCMPFLLFSYEVAANIFSSEFECVMNPDSAKLLSPSARRALCEEKEKASAIRALISQYIGPRTVSLAVFNVLDPTQEKTKDQWAPFRDEYGSQMLSIRATGVIVAYSKERKECLILTSGHVVAGGRNKVMALFADGYADAEVLHNLQGFDYAFVFASCGDRDYAPLILGDSEDILFEEILVSGFMTRGIEKPIFSVFPGRINTELLSDKRRVISTPITAGSSGSGIWTIDGKFLGIVSSFGIVVSSRGERMVSPGSGLMLSGRAIFEDAFIKLRSVPFCQRCNDALAMIQYLREPKQK